LTHNHKGIKTHVLSLSEYRFFRASTEWSPESIFRLQIVKRGFLVPIRHVLFTLSVVLAGEGATAFCACVSECPSRA